MSTQARYSTRVITALVASLSLVTALLAAPASPAQAVAPTVTFIGEDKFFAYCLKSKRKATLYIVEDPITTFDPPVKIESRKPYRSADCPSARPYAVAFMLTGLALTFEGEYWVELKQRKKYGGKKSLGFDSFTVVYPPPGSSYSPSAPSGWSGCYYKGERMFGTVRLVEYGSADYTVYETSYLPDLRVKAVDRLPYSCGEWRFTDGYFYDFTVRITSVPSAADFTIRFVDYGPGR